MPSLDTTVSTDQRRGQACFAFLYDATQGKPSTTKKRPRRRVSGICDEEQGMDKKMRVSYICDTYK